MVMLAVDEIHRIRFRQAGEQRQRGLPPLFVSGRGHVSGAGDQVRLLLADEPDQRSVVPPKACPVQVGELHDGDVVFQFAACQRHFGRRQRKGAEPPQKQQQRQHQQHPGTLFPEQFFQAAALLARNDPLFILPGKAEFRRQKFLRFAKKAV